MVAGALALPLLALKPLFGHTVKETVICSIYPDGAPWLTPGGGAAPAAEAAEPLLMSRRNLTGEMCQPFKDAAGEIVQRDESAPSEETAQCESEPPGQASEGVARPVRNKTKREIGKAALATLIVLGCASKAK